MASTRPVAAPGHHQHNDFQRSGFHYLPSLNNWREHSTVLALASCVPVSRALQPSRVLRSLVRLTPLMSLRLGQWSGDKICGHQQRARASRLLLTVCIMDDATKCLSPVWVWSASDSPRHRLPPRARKQNDAKKLGCGKRRDRHTRSSFVETAQLFVCG